MNDFDERMVDALRGGPDAPTPPPFADVERRAARTTRRHRALAGGALLGSAALVAGILAAQQPDDEDGHTVVVTQPDSTTNPTTSTNTTTPPATTTVPELPAGLPEEIVTFDRSTRQLVVARTATGDVVEVLDTLAEGVELYSLDVAADGTIWYTTVVDAMEGTVHSVVRGGEPVPGPPGSWVAAGPNGQIAVLEPSSLTIYADGDPEGTVVYDGGTTTRAGHRVDWSPDGRWIAVTATYDGLAVFDMSGSATDVGFPVQRFGAAGERRRWDGLTFDPGSRLVVSEHTDCDEGEGSLPGCVEEAPGVRVIDPATGEVLEDLDVPTDAWVLELDVASPSEAALVRTVVTWQPLEMTLTWHLDGRSGSVPGPYSNDAVWAPPATGG